MLGGNQLLSVSVHTGKGISGKRYMCRFIARTVDLLHGYRKKCLPDGCRMQHRIYVFCADRMDAEKVEKGKGKKYSCLYELVVAVFIGVYYFANKYARFVQTL